MIKRESGLFGICLGLKSRRRVGSWEDETESRSEGDTKPYDISESYYSGEPDLLSRVFV